MGAIDRNADVNVMMFTSALREAFANPEARKLYEEETGKRAYTPPPDTFSQKIDEQTGYIEASMKHFAYWFASTQWGPDVAPDLDLIFAKEVAA